MHQIFQINRSIDIAMLQILRLRGQLCGALGTVDIITIIYSPAVQPGKAQTIHMLDYAVLIPDGHLAYRTHIGLPQRMRPASTTTLPCSFPLPPTYNLYSHFPEFFDFFTLSRSNMTRLGAFLDQVVNPAAPPIDGEGGAQPDHLNLPMGANPTNDGVDGENQGAGDGVQEADSAEVRQRLEFAEACMDHYGVEGTMRDEVRRYTKVCLSFQFTSCPNFSQFY